MDTRLSPWIRGRGSESSASGIHPWSQQLSPHLPARYQNEFQSLLRETNAAFAREGLLQLGRRLAAADELDAAARIFSVLSEAGDPAEASAGDIRRRARQGFDALTGASYSSLRPEFLLGRLAKEATEPAGLFGLTAASAVFRATRLASLSRLLASPSLNFFTRGFGARAAAGLIGFGAEAVAFPVATRGAGLVLGRDLDWGAGAVGREIAGSVLVLGAMKLTGLGVGRAWGGKTLNPRLLASAQQGGMLAGIALGHRLESAAGLKAPGDGATNAVDALAFLIQANAAGRFARGLLGEGFHRWEMSLEWRARALKTAAPSAPLFLDRLTGQEAFAFPQAGTRTPSLAPRPPQLILMASSQGNGGGPPPERSGAVYRKSHVPYADKQDALQQLHDGLKEVLDPKVNYRKRLRTLEDLKIFFQVMTEPDDINPALEALKTILEKPRIPKPVLSETNADALPPEIGLFYLQDRELRQVAGEHFLTLVDKTHRRSPAEGVKLAAWARKRLESPEVATDFKPWFGNPLRQEAYRQAVNWMRVDFMKIYTGVLPYLDVGEEEGKKGALLLAESYLLDFIPPYDLESSTLEPEVWNYILDIGRAWAMLRRRVPVHLFEIKQAEYSMKKVVDRIHFDAEDDKEALEVLFQLAYTHTPSRELLKKLAADGSADAKLYLERVESRAEAVRKEYGSKFNYQQWDTRKEATTMRDDTVVAEIVGEIWNWAKRKLKGKKDEEPK